MKKEVKNKKKIQEEIKDLEFEKSQTMKKFREKVSSKRAERTNSETTEDTDTRASKGVKSKQSGGLPSTEQIFQVKRKKGDAISHKERMLRAKEEKRKKQEEDHEMELKAIWRENQQNQSEGRKKQWEQQYRPSTAL